MTQIHTASNLQTIYDFSALSIRGEEVPLNLYRGKVLLIVNVASACGFTPQYQGLQNLKVQFQNSPFEILAFPCNQFGNQESKSNEEIHSFCDVNFRITFPLFEKIFVNGKNAHPLYQFLKTQCPGLFGSELIKWNFTKFLIDHNGIPVKRFAPQTKPEELIDDLKNLLNWK